MLADINEPGPSAYQVRLRELVDSWIASGRGEYPVETPSARRPNAKISAVVRRAFRKQRAIPIPLNDGFAVSVMSERDWLTARRRGRNAAELAFAQMLISDWRLRIAKCIGCGLYFELGHPDHTYGDGTTCRACVPRLKGARSRDSMNQMRQGLQQKLYREAATQLTHEDLKGLWYRHPPITNDLIPHLNRFIGRNKRLKGHYGSGITQSWLTREKNRVAIENMVIERSLRGTLQAR